MDDILHDGRNGIFIFHSDALSHILEHDIPVGIYTPRDIIEMNLQINDNIDLIMGAFTPRDLFANCILYDFFDFRAVAEIEIIRDVTGEFGRVGDLQILPVRSYVLHEQLTKLLEDGIYRIDCEGEVENLIVLSGDEYEHISGQPAIKINVEINDVFWFNLINI